MMTGIWVSSFAPRSKGIVLATHWERELKLRIKQRRYSDVNRRLNRCEDELNHGPELR